MEEEYEKNTSYAEGLVDYRATGLLVSGCKRGEEQLERQVQRSYQEQVLAQPLPEIVTVWDRPENVTLRRHRQRRRGVCRVTCAQTRKWSWEPDETARAKYACCYAVLLYRHTRLIQKPKF